MSRSEDTELREGAISCVDSILRRSPSSISNLEELIHILEEGLQHDPNYCGEFDDDDEEEDEEEDEDDDYSDDEDISWKVSFNLNYPISSQTRYLFIVKTFFFLYSKF